MLRFDIITLFKNYFAPLQTDGITRRAFEKKLMELHFWDVRDFADDAHKTIDDRPYGGGPGMVMMYEPLAKVLKAIQEQRQRCPVILFSPAGTRLSHEYVVQMSQTYTQGAILVCGRYEGIDQRWIDTYVDSMISLGDFVLSGGEIAALALLDAMIRQLPGVLNSSSSCLEESFVKPLLDHPHYTRPSIIEGKAVPQVLLEGNHQAVQAWRTQQALALTEKLRPDLLKKFEH